LQPIWRNDGAFVQGHAGATNVYRRFDKYKPRDSGTPDWTAGPKIVHFERVE
jgi:hypothetical protein